MNAATKWTLWGTGVATSFAVLEAVALREEIIEGKPRGTLTAVLRRGIGIQPSLPRRWALGSLLIAVCGWFAGHICLGWPPNSTPKFLRSRP